MAFVEGDRFKHKFTGKLYEVKIIKDDTFILESADTPYRMWFDEEGLELFFERAEKKRPQKSELPKLVVIYGDRIAMALSKG